MKTSIFIFLLISTMTTMTASVAEAQTRTATRAVNNGNVVLDGVPEIPEEISDTIRPYIQSRAARLQCFDGAGRAHILTRFGDVDHLHRVDQPGGDRQQLTFGTHPLKSAACQPTGLLVAYTIDQQGGTENTQISIWNPAIGRSRMITDGTSLNDYPRWSRDGKRLAFRSIRPKSDRNEIVVYDLRTNTSTVVFKAPNSATWWPADWLGNTLLLGEYKSVAQSAAWILDLTTGGLPTLVAGDTGETQTTNLALSFGADARSVLIATNRFGDHEFNNIAIVKNGRIRPVTSDIRWDAGYVFAVARDHRTAAFVVNAGGISNVYLLDTTSLKRRRVPLPTGVVSNVMFTQDGKTLGVALSSSQSPTDLYTTSVKNPTSLKRWTRSEVGGLNTDSFVMPRLIEYPSDGFKIPAFMYEPAKKGPHPVMIIVHGGPEGQFTPGFFLLAQLLVHEFGIAVIAPNVRGSSGYGQRYLTLDNGRKRKDAVKDIGALLDWIATQPNLDSSRVGVFGGSYGGYMATAVCVDYGDKLRGCISVVGIQNFVTFLEGTAGYRRDLRRVEYGDERDPDMRRFLLEISPFNHASEINTAMFFAAGMMDPRVPFGETEHMVKALRKNGKQAWYMLCKNEGHSFAREDNNMIFIEVLVLFLQQHLLAE